MTEDGTQGQQALEKRVDRIVGFIWGWILQAPWGVLASAILGVLQLFDFKQKIQALIQSELNVYVPGSSILVFLVGAVLCVWILEQLLRKHLNPLTDTQTRVLLSGSRKRRFFSAAMILIALGTIAGPYWLGYRHYHPDIHSGTFLVYIDPFDIEGWDQKELVRIVKRDLQRELAQLLPEADLRILEVPQGIRNQEERLDWACESGAKIIIYATGSADRISPRIRPCSRSISRLPVFFDDTIDTRIDRPTASYRLKSTPRYELLDPTYAQKLCMMEVLMPERVNYLALLALGLVCINDDIPGLDTSERLKFGHDLFSRAVELEEGATDCSLDYCEALNCLGMIKLQMSQVQSDSASSLRLLCEADTVLSLALRVRPDFVSARMGRAYLLLLGDQLDSTVASCREIIELVGDSTNLAIQVSIASVLQLEGFALGKLNRNEEQIEVYDGIIRRFGDRADLSLERQVAMALVNKGGALGQINRSEDAIGVYDEVVRRFEDDNDLILMEQVAMALVRKGVVLSELDRSEEALEAYDEVVRRVGHDPDPVLRELVARALVNEAVEFGVLGRSEDAIEVCDEYARRFENDSDAADKERSATTLFVKGVSLGKLDRCEDAIGVYDEIVRRFGDERESRILVHVAKALTNKAVELKRQGRSEEAVSALCAALKLRQFFEDEVVERLHGYLRESGVPPEECE